MTLLSANIEVNGLLKKKIKNLLNVNMHIETAVN